MDWAGSPIVFWWLLLAFGRVRLALVFGGFCLYLVPTFLRQLFCRVCYPLLRTTLVRQHSNGWSAHMKPTITAQHTQCYFEADRKRDESLVCWEKLVIVQRQNKMCSAATIGDGRLMHS